MYDDQINELNAKRRQVGAELRLVLDGASTERRGLTVEEKRRADMLDADLESLNDQVQQLLDAAKRAKAADPRIAAEFDRLARPSIRPFGARAADSGTLGDRLARAVAAVRSGSVATANVETRSLIESTAAGHLVPVEVADPELTLRAASVTMSIPGVRVMNMTADRLRIPRIATATVTTVAEAASISPTDPDVDAVDLVAVKLGVLTALSSELVEDAPADVLQVFGQNQLESLARALDLQLLQGTGSSGDLVGLRSQSGISTTSVAAVPADFDDIADIVYSARNANAVPTCFVTHPRVWSTYSKIRTGITSDQTTLLQPDPQQAAASLSGLPVLQSTQITTTEGATSVGSWIAAVDGTQVIIGERRPATFEVSRDLYFDSDRIAIRCTGRWGFALLNASGVSIATDVRA